MRISPLSYAYVYGQAIEYTHIVMTNSSTQSKKHHLRINWKQHDRGKYKLNIDGSSAVGESHGSMGESLETIEGIAVCC